MGAFLGDFFANFLATVFGVGLSVYFGIKLYRWQEREAQGIRSRDEADRRGKLLRLTKEELVYDLVEAERRRNLVHGHSGSYLGPRLKTELWRALSDGGELHWIKDLDLMATLAEAYYRLGEAAYLEGRYLELGRHVAGDLCDLLFLAYGKVSDAVKPAVERIDTALS